jgi:hypothetical protein
VAIGRVSSREFLLTPSRRFIFGVYKVQIVRLLRQVGSPEGAALIKDGSIRVVRPGGAVCTAEGRLEAYYSNEPPLQVGKLYILHLTHDIDTGVFFSSPLDLVVSGNDAQRLDTTEHTGLSVKQIATDLETMQCE